MPRRNVIEIPDLDERLLREWYHTDPSLPAKQAFEYEFLLLDSRDVLLNAINWCWLQWHAAPKFDVIARETAMFALRSLQIRTKPPKASCAFFAPVHDWLLMVCGVLSGDRETMLQLADKLKGASSRSKRNQYYQSLVGILIGRITRDPKLVASQFSILKRSRWDGEYGRPSRELVIGFVAQDGEMLNSAINEGVKAHWTTQHNGRTRSGPLPVVTEKMGKKLIDLGNKDRTRWWAYPEATFAKLAAIDGIEIVHNDFWFPRQLVLSTSDCHDSAKALLAEIETGKWDKPAPKIDFHAKAYQKLSNYERTKLHLGHVRMPGTLR